MLPLIVISGRGAGGVTGPAVANPVTAGLIQSKRVVLVGELGFLVPSSRLLRASPATAVRYHLESWQADRPDQCDPGPNNKAVLIRFNPKTDQHHVEQSAEERATQPAEYR